MIREVLDEGLTSRALEETTFFPKGCQDGRYNYGVDNPLKLSFISNMLVIPLKSSGGMLGVIQLFNRSNIGNCMYEVD